MVRNNILSVLFFATIGILLYSSFGESDFFQMIGISTFLCYIFLLANYVPKKKKKRRRSRNASSKEYIENEE